MINISFRFCHLPMTPDEPHPMNQNILISNGKHSNTFIYVKIKTSPFIMAMSFNDVCLAPYSMHTVYFLYFFFQIGLLNILFDILTQDIDSKLLVSFFLIATLKYMLYMHNIHACLFIYDF